MVREEFEVLHFLALGDIRREKGGELQKDRWLGLHYIHRIDPIRMLGIKTEKAQPKEAFSSLFSLWPTHRQVPEMAGLIVLPIKCGLFVTTSVSDCGLD